MLYEVITIPKLVVRGTTAATQVYMSYFDHNHTQSPVKFRYGTINNANTMTDGLAQDIRNNFV